MGKIVISCVIIMLNQNVYIKYWPDENKRQQGFPSPTLPLSYFSLHELSFEINGLLMGLD